MTLNVVILAAGKGTRMRSDLPKVLHPIANKSMVEHVIDTAKNLGSESINLVYGYGGDQLKDKVQDDSIAWVLQADQLGTGHAVAQANRNIEDDDTVLVLYGDVPLIQTSTLDSLLNVKPKNGLAVLTVNLVDPSGYGRIVRSNGHVVGIVEQKDANAEQLAIQEVNTGIMAVPGKQLKTWLSQLSSDNAQGEYYLTDIIAMAHRDGIEITTSQPESAIEVEGANNRVQLAQLERAYQLREAEKLMLAGANLRDPNRIDIRGNVIVGMDVMIDVNTVFEGDVIIGNGVTIGAGAIIINSSIADNAVIKPYSIIENAIIGEDASAGPFARLRPGAELKQDAHVGNFVEMKKSVLGKGSKAGHLTYLGDAQIGEKVNIGAGTITCNYDGVNKSLTKIDDGAFIGSNSSLVAPVEIGKMATIGAGSVVTSKVEDEQLAVARGKQRNLNGWKRPVKK